MLPPADTQSTGDPPTQPTPTLVDSTPASQLVFDLQASNSLNRSSPSDTARSDSAFSLSSNSPGEYIPQIVGTPFDIGSQRFEYPFPQTQGSPVEPFLPISSSITSASHANLPPWPLHTNKSFPLTAPPLSRVKAHPKLRNANAREPPVPPGLVKRRSRLSAGLQRQFSDEQSDKSDSSEGVQRGRRPTRFSVSFTGADLQHSSKPLETLPTRQSASRSSRSLEHPTAEHQAGSNVDTGQAVGQVNPPVVSLFGLRY
ncbi:hypothetical protein F5I97DRAFT_2039612 [Phlebopus sp. FC_14]|nr:hypothetical protein F5I97DRAFT_2039612 [Phlebopus sp. FC_14]